jgi:MFS family permease
MRMFESLQYRQFGFFFLAMLSQMSAQNIQMVVRAYLAYELTGSYAALGTIALVNSIPGLGLALVGGVIADRIPSRRLVMMIGQSSNAINTLGLALLIFTDVITFEWLCVGAFIQGTTMALMMPSRQSLIPSLVPGPMMMNAVALNAAGMNGTRLFAPAVGGLLFAAAGAASVYFLMAGLYALACVFILKVPDEHRITESAGNPWKEMKVGLSNMFEGLRYIKGDAVMGPLLLINVIIVLLAMPYMFLLAGFVQDVLNGDAADLGWLTTISGLSAVGAALVIAGMPRKHRGAWFLVGSAFQGAMLFVGFVFATNVLMMMVAMFFMGFGQAARQSLSNVLVQEYVEDAYRGRVMAIYMLQFSLASLGTAVIGALAGWLGPQTALGGTSMTLVVICLGTLAFSKRLRTLQ